jgi:hypothetical protein
VWDGVALLGFAIAWNAIALTIAYFVRGSDAPAPARWIVYAFAILGFFLLWGGLRSLFLGFRYSRSALVLNSVPQNVGKKLSARFEAPKIPDGAINTFVRCHLRRTTRPAREVLWSEEREVSRGAVHQSPNGFIIPIEFTLPPDARETENLGAPDEVTWRVGVAIGDKDAPKMSADFLIPVFGGRRQPADDFEELLGKIEDPEVRRKIREDIASAGTR